MDIPELTEKCNHEECVSVFRSFKSYRSGELVRSNEQDRYGINANCRMVLELEGTPIGNEMKAIQQKWFSSFDEFIDHKDEIRYYDVGDGAALAEYLIREENVFGEIPHELLKHIDYHSYGSELEMDDRYLFTTSGVFRYQ